jgi:hypothetical protein
LFKCFVVVISLIGLIFAILLAMHNDDHTLNVDAIVASLASASSAFLIFAALLVVLTETLANPQIKNFLISTFYQDQGVTKVTSADFIKFFYNKYFVYSLMFLILQFVLQGLGTFSMIYLSSMINDISQHMTLFFM